MITWLTAFQFWKHLINFSTNPNEEMFGVSDYRFWFFQALNGKFNKESLMFIKHMSDNGSLFYMRLYTKLPRNYYN